MLYYNHRRKTVTLHYFLGDDRVKNFCIFVDALDFIEANLCEPITQDDIAAACYCSLSTLQKVWRYCTHTSLKEYISKRRLTKCAEEISNSCGTITDIAMKYQYNSPEVFNRAFTKLWGVAPSRFNKEWKFTGVFPRLIPDEMIKGGIYMGKMVDVSELYEFLRSKAGTYVLCFDVVGLMPVNDNFGHKAGDKVILESLKRLDTAAGDDMMLFRIGGDEFALVTCLEDKAKVEALAEKILVQNGNEVESDGNRIPVSLRAGAIKYSGEHFRYSDLFVTLQNAINEARDNGKLYFIN